MTENYYSILELNSSCSVDDIKSAYRKLAIKWHPDKNKSMDKKEIENKFKNITKAYQVLSDIEARKKYDEFGVTDNTDNLIDPYLLFSNVFDNDDNDIPDVIVYIESDINKLYNGYTENVSYIRYSQCSKCNCTGTYEKINGDCKNCSGKGILMEKVKGGKMGYMFNEKKCNICNGFGMDPEIKKCKKCDGNKYIKENIECSIDIPAGAYDGYYIMFENEGNYIPLNDRRNNNDRSNVKFVIKENILLNNISRGVFIKELKHMDRSDILLDVNISFAESLSGIKKEIEYLCNEKICIETDEIIQNNDIFVIKNKGMCYVPEENKENKRGNLFIRFRVSKPELTNKQRKKLWQILTETPYQIYNDISDTIKLQSIDNYIKEYKIELSSSENTETLSISSNEENRKIINYR